jgi:peptidoglycan/xylan/chitin deacetylase (PgdA/CDA1 family)
MRRTLRSGVAWVDRRATRVGLRLERPALISFLFHAVFADREEVESGLIHPQEAMTEAQFRLLLEHFLGAGYRFVSIEEIEKGLPADERCVCITFDDGYANNLRLLDLLREFRAPAAIFVSTNHVERGKRYWWDTVYAERLRRGSSLDDIEREIESLKERHPAAIEAYVDDAFGSDASKPRSDLDRPLTPAEVGVLGREELVTIGNHTQDHAILIRLSGDEIRDQIVGAQLALERMTGSTPRAIAYPNGDYDRVVIETVKSAGLMCGITTVRRKEQMPISAERLLELGRLQLEEHVDLEAQLRLARSGIQLGNAARRMRKRNVRSRH